MVNRRNRYGRNVGNVRSRMAARNSRLSIGNQQRATGHSMTRRRFLGTAAAGVAGAMIGGAGVARAQAPPTDCNVNDLTFTHVL